MGFAATGKRRYYISSMINNKAVAVGLSGGVDSAMAARLLLDDGYQVIGLTMSIWDESIPLTTPHKSGCFGPGEAEDLQSAAAICAQLGIEHHIIRLQSEYKENVLSYFCSTYLDGKTPNPCLICNQRIKFGLLPQTAREQGIRFDYFATGHYVRTIYNHALNRHQLLKALDPAKDQSYFLAFLQQEQLSNLLFPLGDKTKQEVKSLAPQLGFSQLAQRPESQDFLETDDYDVLFEQGTFRPGDIVDYQGQQLGRHRGLIHYTVGQRKNLGIAGLPEPYYVIRLEPETNTLVVGPKPYLYHDQLRASQLNWLSVAPRQQPFRATAKIRLQHEAAPCIITPVDQQSALVRFDTPQLSITPGQAVVFYAEDIVLAGGIID